MGSCDRGAPALQRWHLGHTILFASKSVSILNSVRAATYSAAENSDLVAHIARQHRGSTLALSTLALQAQEEVHCRRPWCAIEHAWPPRWNGGRAVFAWHSARLHDESMWFGKQSLPHGMEAS